MRRILLLSVLIFWAAAMFAAEAKPIIKIGAILPLSGDMANVGEDMRVALKMGIAEQKLKPSKYEYQIIYEDSQNIPRMAAEAFKKLSEIDHVSMVLTCFGGPSSTVAVLAGNKKIIHIGMAFSTTVSKPPYSFNNYAKPGPNAELAARFCQAAGFKRVAFLGQQQASTNALEACFKKAAPNYGIEIVSVQKFAPPERDFRVAILKLRETKPDVLFIDAFEPEAPIIVKQMKEIAWDIPFTAMAHWGTFNNPLFLNIPYTEIAPSKDYIRRFQALYKRQPVYFAGYLQDSLDMYIKCCEEYQGSGTPPAEFISRKLQSLKDYPGIMGKLSPDEKGWFDTPAAMVIQTPEGRKEITMEDAVKLINSRK